MRQRADVAGVLGLLALGLALPPLVGSWLHLQSAAGSDVDLWVLAARNLSVGAVPHVPPLWPALLTWLSPFGAELAAGRGLAWFFSGLVGPACFLLARSLGAAPLRAALAAVLVALEPTLVGFGLQVQPDALAALGFVAATGAALHWVRRPGSRSLALVFLAVALLPLVREQGIIVAALLLCLLVLSPGTASDRGLRLLAGMVVLVLGPLLLGLSPGAPWDQPWASRIAMAARELMPGALPTAVSQLPAEASAALVRAYREGDRITVSLFHLRWALGSAPVLWAAVFLALPAALRGGRQVALVGLIPVLPALAIWSEPRHVAIALPVVGAVLAAAATTRRRQVGGVVLGLAAGFAWPGEEARLHVETDLVGRLLAFGEALCARVEPGDMGSGEPGAFLGCPLPIHGVETDRAMAADWKVWLAGDEEQVAGWTQVELGDDTFRVFRLEPWRTGAERPCANSLPAPGTPYFGSPPPAATLAPPCAEVPDDPEVRDPPPPPSDRPSAADDRPRVKPHARNESREEER